MTTIDLTCIEYQALYALLIKSRHEGFSYVLSSKEGRRLMTLLEDNDSEFEAEQIWQGDEQRL